jgi:class 3 adenylate cyclase
VAVHIWHSDETGGDAQPENTISIEGERKYATIMFSDMSGYTKMTESLDPEEVKDILSLVFAKMNEIIKSYDGFVEKYIGDAVMAVFGVPKPMRMIRSERFGRL